MKINMNQDQNLTVQELKKRFIKIADLPIDSDIFLMQGDVPL